MVKFQKPMLCSKLGSMDRKVLSLLTFYSVNDDYPTV